MREGRRKLDGWMLIEVLTAIAVLGVLMSALAISLNSFSRFNHYQLTRQRCIAAAQAQLESIAVTGHTLSAEEIERGWPGITLSVRREDGLGDWEGLELIRVTAQGKAAGKDVKVELARYAGKK